MPKTKEEFQTDLIRNLECRYLEANPTGGAGSKRGKLVQLGSMSYVAMSPDEVDGIAEILTNAIYDETNAEKLSKYRSSKAGKERNLIQQELFPAQKLFPRDAINAQRKKVADDLGKIALGLMLAPESKMEPEGSDGAVAATTPDSSRS